MALENSGNFIPRALWPLATLCGWQLKIIVFHCCGCLFNVIIVGRESPGACVDEWLSLCKDV